jgi:outer membrane protein TolC
MTYKLACLRTFLLFSIILLSHPARGEDAVSTGISLQQVRELVLLQNLQIESERLGWDISRHILKAERGAIFEPELAVGIQEERNERENTSEQFIAQGVEDFEENNTLYSVTLEQPLPTGGRLSAGYTLQDLENNLAEQRELENQLEREFVGFLGITFNQPLLRNGGFSAALAAFRLARAESEVSFQNYRRQLMQALAGAEAAYWDLVIAQDRLRFRNASIEVAEKVLEDNRLRVENGLMSDLEVQRAEAGLALRRAQQREAAQTRYEAAARLKSLFAELMPEADVLLVASERPRMNLPGNDRDASLSTALTLHPEYLARKAQIEQDRVRAKFASNQRLPQLDFSASYGYNGLGADTGDAWSETTDGDYPAWTVGLQMRVPLGGGIRARNEYAAAVKKLGQSELGLESAKIELGNQLASGWQRVENTFEQAEGYRKVMEMSGALLETELARLELGQSDSREVLEAEEQLTQARESHAESLTRYRVALLELELADGSLLVNRDADPLNAAGYTPINRPAERAAIDLPPPSQPMMARPLPVSNPMQKMPPQQKTTLPEPASPAVKSSAIIPAKSSPAVIPSAEVPPAPAARQKTSSGKSPAPAGLDPSKPMSMK